LRTISRIQPAIAGSIEIEGVPLSDLSSVELARKVGVVLTERVEAGALPGYRVVELGRYPHLSWSGRLSDRDHDVVTWAIEAVGARHLAGRDSSKLSDGERQ
jgi:iron complex transport system ATP-binding protein